MYIIVQERRPVLVTGNICLCIIHLKILDGKTTRLTSHVTALTLSMTVCHAELNNYTTEQLNYNKQH